MSSEETRPIRQQSAGDGRSEHAGHDDPDDGLGAVEGETPTDPQRGNPAGTGVDDEGEPNDPIRTGQDRIGANLDETEG